MSLSSNPASITSKQPSPSESGSKWLGIPSPSISVVSSLVSRIPSLSSSTSISSGIPSASLSGRISRSAGAESTPGSQANAGFLTVVLYMYPFISLGGLGIYNVSFLIPEYVRLSAEVISFQVVAESLLTCQSNTTFPLSSPSSVPETLISFTDWLFQ